MNDKPLKPTRREYSPNQRLAFLAPLAPVFLFLLPWGFISLGKVLDGWLQWPPILPEPANLILGLLLLGLGLFFALWSIYSQFTIGRGTPVPLLPTQKLVVQPPFNYCRNPMSLGTILAYAGVALVFHTLGGVVVVLFFGALLLIGYVKGIEEKELAARFGQEYLDYKRRTPFLIPRFWRRR